MFLSFFAPVHGVGVLPGREVMMKKYLIVMSALALAFATGCGGDDDKPECSNANSKTCEGGKVKACVDGKWKFSECEAGHECSGAGICVSKAECDSSFVAKCEGQTLKYCSNGSIASTNCAAEGKTCGQLENGTYSCISSGGNTGCTNGTTQCGLDDVNQKCVDGVWVDDPCKAGWKCQSGSCVNQTPCTNGATRCSTNGMIVETCSNTEWGQTKQCNADERCSVKDGVASCVDKGNAPEVGSSCDVSFTSVCVDNVAYNCSSEDKVVARDCNNVESSACITLSSNNWATCGLLGEEIDEMCSYDGEMIGFEWSCTESPVPGAMLYLGCHLIGGTMYGVVDLAISACMEQPNGVWRVQCSEDGRLVGGLCPSGCTFDDNTFTASCNLPAVGETCPSGFSSRCKDNKTRVFCDASNKIAENACAGTETCLGDACINTSSIPNVGGSCNEAVFAEQCLGNVAIFCEENTIKAWNCVSDSGKCLSVEDDTVWCAYLDSQAYDQCDYDGQIVFYSNSYACQLYTPYNAIIFDSCHVIDGQMYFIEDRVAASVCQNNNRRYCSSATNIATQNCSGTCTFDGWDAVCK